MSVIDRYRERARAEFFEDVETGNGFRVNEPLDELGGRSLVETWRDGDHEAVERWLDDAYARTEAIVECHRNDPAYMAMIERLRAELHAEQSKPRLSA